jgi:hypothetical protein
MKGDKDSYDILSINNPAIIATPAEPSGVSILRMVEIEGLVRKIQYN